MAKQPGRPSDYTAELGEDICSKVAEGVSLRKISQQDGMPDKSTVMRWLIKHKDFSDLYARAREAQADYWADEIMDIADETTGDQIKDGKGNVRTDHEAINRSRLRVDTRKWLMARMAPHKYGDRMAVTTPPGEPFETKDTNPRDLARAVLGILREAGMEKPK